MRYHSIGVLLTLAASISMAQAHVRIQPAQSQQGAKQKYTLRAPTEGKIATIALMLDVPDGVSAVSAEGQAELAKEGGRIVSITWKVKIPPGQSQTFTFEATSPPITEARPSRCGEGLVDGTDNRGEAERH